MITHPSAPLIHVVGSGVLANITRECCSQHFTIVAPSAANLVWVCHDTPILDGDVPDNDWLLAKLHEAAEQANDSALIVVSSQVRVGTTRLLEQRFPNKTFAHSPENIRVKTARQDFLRQPRIVVGVRSPDHHTLLEALFAPFTPRVIFTDPESAEMVKHALNCYLGMSIAFANEIAVLAARVGGNMSVITEALRTDSRVSPSAPLVAGAPFGGGHLSRDLNTVCDLAKKHGLSLPVIQNILASNIIR
jgi:UDPglucose 6-dehydrogenase